MYTTGQMLDLMKPGMRAIGRNPECHVWDGIEVFAVQTGDNEELVAIRCINPLPHGLGIERSLPLCGQVMALKWELLDGAADADN